jgi:hypothetical protein
MTAKAPAKTFMFKKLLSIVLFALLARMASSPGKTA